MRLTTSRPELAGGGAGTRYSWSLRNTWEERPRVFSNSTITLCFFFGSIVLLVRRFLPETLPLFSCFLTYVLSCMLCSDGVALCDPGYLGRTHGLTRSHSSVSMCLAGEAEEAPICLPGCLPGFPILINVCMHTRTALSTIYVIYHMI